MNTYTDININEFISTRIETCFTEYGIDLSQKESENIWKPLIAMSKLKNMDYDIVNIGQLFKRNGKQKIMDLLPKMCGKLNELSENLFEISHMDSFLNFKLTNLYLYSQIIKMMKEKKIRQTIEPENILIDHSSPNVAKDMHVGHLRSTIIGNVLSNLFEMQGHKVFRINHIGDYGLQFGMITQYIIENNLDQSEHIENLNLQEIYTLSKKKFEDDSEFKAKSYANTVVLQKYDKSIDIDDSHKKIYGIWNKICAISKVQYDAIYKKLNINLTEMSESFYKDKIEDTITELKNKGILIMEDNRSIIKTKYGVLTIIKSDGGYTYDTTDLTALKYRLVHMKMNRIYYVVDSGQSSHFSQIFDVAKSVGWLTDQHVEHINFGVVCGEDGKRIKSRNGSTPKLNDLLNQAVTKTIEVVKEKNSELISNMELIENLAHSSIKYADLSITRTNDYTFSFTKMINFSGNTLCYVMYCRTRAMNIINNYMKAINAINAKNIDMKIEWDVYLRNGINSSELNKADFDVILLMMELDNVIQKTIETCSAHHICTFLHKLSDNIHSMYHMNRCIEYESDATIKSINYSRIAIYYAVINIVDKCFNILGIKPIDKL